MRDVSENYGIPSRTSDPSSPADGDIWYRSDQDRILWRNNSVTVPLFLEPHGYRSIVAGAWYDVPMLDYNSPASNMSPILNKVHTHPFSVPRAVTLNGICVCVSTAGTSSNVGRTALYTGADGPVTLVTDYGTVSQTSTGVKSWTPSSALVPGVQYWIAYASQVGTSASVSVGTRSSASHTIPALLSGTPTSTEFLAKGGHWYTWTASGAFAGSPTLVLDQSNQTRLMLKFA